MIALYIVLGFAAVFGLYALFSSDKSNPKERAAEAGAAALGGAAAAMGCIIQLILPVILLLIGIWLFAKIFG